MRKISPQRQLFNCLKTEAQRRYMAMCLRHLKSESQELLCIALVAFLRWGVLEQFDTDSWLQRQFDAMRIYLMAENVTYQSKPIRKQQ